MINNALLTIPKGMSDSAHQPACTTAQQRQQSTKTCQHLRHVLAPQLLNKQAAFSSIDYQTCNVYAAAMTAFCCAAQWCTCQVSKHRLPQRHLARLPPPQLFPSPLLLRRGWWCCAVCAGAAALLCFEYAQHSHGQFEGCSRAWICCCCLPHPFNEARPTTQRRCGYKLSQHALSKDDPVPAGQHAGQEAGPRVKMHAADGTAVRAQAPAAVVLCWTQLLLTLAVWVSVHEFITRLVQKDLMLPGLLPAHALSTSSWANRQVCCFSSSLPQHTLLCCVLCSDVLLAAARVPSGSP